MKIHLDTALLQPIKAVFNSCSTAGLQKFKQYMDVLKTGIKWNTMQGLDLVLCNMVTQNNDIATPVIMNGQPLVADTDLHLVLQCLGLMQKYPQKITLKDALGIKHEVPNLRKCNLTELPGVVLQKIMVCDETSRAYLVPAFVKFVKVKNADSDSSDSSDSESADSDDADYDENVYPVDTVLALLHCSDNFLRQLLLQKLSLCQISVPMLLPDPIRDSVTLLLWALRSVENTWNGTDSNGEPFSVNHSIADYEGPIISFLKCGNLSKSKSKLLNGVIGKQDIFYHWDLEMQKCRKKITPGVVEACCYYPNHSDDFSKIPIIFTNLRGSATNYKRQVNFIKTVSFMSFVLMTKKSIESKDENVVKLLQMLNNSPGGVVIVLVDSKSYKKRKLSELCCEHLKAIGIAEKTSAVIYKEIKEVIAHELQKNTDLSFISISKTVDAIRNLKIDIDEDDVDCRNAKHRVANIMMHASDDLAKNTLFPLQAPDIWHEWAKSNKERFRIQKKPKHMESTEYQCLKDKEKTKIRCNQLCSTMSPFFQSFLINVLECKGPERNYILH